MCTVTYIPNKEGGFYLTFNRDEKTSRETVLPEFYSHNGIELLYPKDLHAGGTWIATSQNGKTACLLNGAFENHERKNFYERSRGLVLLESFYYDSIYEFVRSVNLSNIEPFTLLLLEPYEKKDFSFYELRWDGEEKHLKPLSNEKPHIWSSATLYSIEIQKKRRDIFFSWLTTRQSLSELEIFQFQSQRHGLTDSEDFIMKGQGDLKTLSIAQLNSDNTDLKFKYLDLSSEKMVQFDLKAKEATHV